MRETLVQIALGMFGYALMGGIVWYILSLIPLLHNSEVFQTMGGIIGLIVGLGMFLPLCFGVILILSYIGHVTWKYFIR